MADFSKEEELVGRYVEENNKEAAIKLLYELIVKSAREKNFVKAKALREKIYEVDPMALTEIVKAGEVIEQGESEFIDQKHLDIWSKLYDELTTEEANAFYYALKEGTYDADQTIFKQGDLNSNLYFINQGQLKLVWRQGGGEVLLKSLGTGSIVGEDPFFSNIVCTTSLITISPVKLNYLERAMLAKWKDEFPGLEPRLYDYCAGSVKISDILKKRSLDRRSQKRRKISGKGMVRILNASGSPVSKAFKGSLSDISVGGLSFMVRISNKKTPRMLLGRKLNVEFALTTAGSEQKIDVYGVVIGAIEHPFDDYSIHIKFDKMLSEEIVKSVTI